MAEQEKPRPADRQNNEAEKSAEEHGAGSGFSRREFIKGTGLASVAISAGTLLGEKLLKAAKGEDAAAGGAVLGPGPVPVTLHVNGQTRQLQIEPRVTLLDALRDRLDLTGAKKVCDRATCGACTVIVDGKAVYSCGMLAIEAQGHDI